MLSRKMNIEDLGSKLEGKRVLMRVDFNVPISDGKVTDANRIAQTVPTIMYAFDHKAKCVILMSHCGRPDGRRQEKFTLRPVAEALEKLLGRKVTFLDDCVGSTVENACLSAAQGSVILLENLRFYAEEEGKGVDDKGGKFKPAESLIKVFRDSLTKLGDIYINDAFGTAHRAHSSMVGVALPVRAAGLLMKKELDYFGAALENPKRPFLAILGGAKVKDKIQLINNLLDKVDIMIIGGGMAFTFLKKTKGMKIGKSLYDEDGAAIVDDIMANAVKKNVKIVLPEDFVCGSEFKNDATIKKVTLAEGVPDDYMGMDIGEKSIATATEVIKQSKTIVFNGPPGVFEFDNFSNGSRAFLDAVVSATAAGATSIVGGGDTASLAEKYGKVREISHVSTGGGASLELLEGKDLPGVVALSDK